MTRSIQQRHDEVVQQLVDRYRDEGYVVERQPQLSGTDGVAVRPDIVARHSKGDTVMLEVSVNSPAARTTRPIGRLAALAQKAGWRFVVVVADGRTIEEVEVPDAAMVEARISEAEALDPRSSAAPLLAWAALESAARVALARSGSRMLRSQSARAVIQQIASLGLVSPDEETSLHVFAETRNRMAHGMWSARHDPEDVRHALAIARRLLTTDEVAATA